MSIIMNDIDVSNIVTAWPELDADVLHSDSHIVLRFQGINTVS